MSGVNLHTAAANLYEALERLEAAWQTTREAWSDEASLRFEEQHVAPIRPKVMAALDGIHRLSDVLKRAERECADRRNQNQ